MLVVVAGLLVLGAAVFLACLESRRKAPLARPADSREWLAAFSVDDYRPMLRLFDPCDREWLEMQPGYDSRCVRRLLDARAALLRDYLRRIGRDGRRLHAVAWRLAAPAQHDVANLAAFIARQAWVLEYFLFRVRVRLAVARVVGGAVDPRPVFESLQALSRAVKQAAQPAPQRAAPETEPQRAL
jgi:hypothetical protein